MLNKLMAAGGVLVLLAGIAILILPGGRIPLLDANREILAESVREAYCSGIAYGVSRGGGSEEEYQVCYDDSAHSEEVMHELVIYNFCVGLSQRMKGMSVDACRGIMNERRFWPTKDGRVTDSWNRTFPWPGGKMGLETVDGRTGTRDANERNELGR